MTIRHSLLALLGDGPSYGYQLRADFERNTGGTWPLNIGQVYSTLDRLERDGLVEATEQGDDDQNYYAITDAGRAELAQWFHTPVPRTAQTKDELTVKLALALTQPGVDVRVVIQTQRAATMRAMQDLARVKMNTPEATMPSEAAWPLVLESMIFSMESEIRWLDYSEASLARLSGSRTASDASAAENTTASERKTQTLR